MADFGGFVKERDNLLAARGAGQAQCSIERGENVIANSLQDVSNWRRLSHLDDNRHKKIAFEGERRHGGCDGYHSSLRKNDTLEKTPQFAGGRLSPSGRPPNSPLKIKEVLAACGIAAPFSFFPTCALML